MAPGGGNGYSLCDPVLLDLEPCVEALYCNSRILLVVRELTDHQNIPNPGAPNSPKQVMFIYFRPQSRYYLYTWSPRVIHTRILHSTMDVNHEKLAVLQLYPISHLLGSMDRVLGGPKGLVAT